MLRRLKSISITISLVFALLAVAQSSFAFSYTLEISESELQEKVSAMMPMKKKNMFVAVTVSDPKVDLIKESNEIGVFTHVKVSAPGGIYGKGRGKVTGTLSYDASKGAFFFKNPKIVNLELDQVPKEYVKNIQLIAQVTAAQAMSVYPVYILNDENQSQKFAKSRLESVEVKDEELHVVLRLF